MHEVRANTQPSLGRSDESVEWALRELEVAVAGSDSEPRAREALEVLRRAFTSVRASAATDPLTGLANRASFYTLLDERLALSSAGTAAILFLDLDGFKDVNDQHGHQAGDALLAQVAGRISNSVRENDLVARHGGDEFVVLLEHFESAAVAHSVAARIIEAISAPFVIDGSTVWLGVSIGLAYFPDHGRSGSELLRHADTAMYRVKNAGGRNYAVFGERDDLLAPRSPLRSWTWELAVSPRIPLELPSNDVTISLLHKKR